MKSIIKLTLGLLAGAAALFSVTSSQAQLNFHVNLNTSPLVGSAAGPFALDFQLNDGSGTFATPNTATLSNFTFGGGSPLGAATTTAGVTGDLSSAITLTDTSAFPTEFYQQFTAGSQVDFDVTITTLPESPAPDAFSVAILDSTLANIATNGLGDSLVLLNITSTNLTYQDVQTFSANAPFGGVVATASVPEPGVLGALGSLLLVGGGSLLSRRRRSA